MQLLLVEWHGGRHLPQEAASDALKGFAKHGEWAKVVAAAAEAARRDGEENADEETPAPSPEIRMAWRECEQLNSAILKNNETKRKISRRLKNNSRQAERFKADLDGKITGEDRNQLMKLQYRIGKLELDNMELEQNRIVHESAMREKDLTIQKLQLQLALRDRIAMLQQSVLQKHGIEACLECPGVVSGNSVNQGGITDALDALLLEEGFRISPESRGAEDDNGRADFEQIDVIDTNRGVDRPIARGRRGGWSSPPPQDKDDRSVKLVRAASDTNVAVMDSCDSDGRTDRGSVSNSPLRVPMKTSIVSSPITIVDKEDDGMHHLVGCMKQAFPGKTDDDGNGDEVERGRGRRTTGKSQRTGGMKGARTRSTQPLPPTLRSRPQETRPPQTHRVSTGAAGAAVDHQRLGNREKESLYEGLVISSIPCGYVERKCTRAAPGDVKGGSTLTQEVPPTSVEVAPFHGLVPASPLASSYSHVNNDTLGGRAPSIILNPAADGRTLCQEDGSLLDTVAVVGVSLKQQASNKGFHQRVIPTAGGNDRWRRSQGNALGAKEVTVTVPIRTWDEVDGRRDRCKEGARRDSDQDASDDVEDLAVMPSGTGEPIAAAVRDGGRDRRGKLVNRKSYAHKVSSFEVEAASSGQANKGGGGIFCMGARLTRGISGESVKYMPWGERREGSTALIAAVRSGPDRGATHQRIRREKIGKASEPSNRSKACNHAGDGGGD